MIEMQPAYREPKATPKYRGLDIEFSSNGGFVVRCHKRLEGLGKDGPMFSEPDVKVFESAKSLQSFLVGAISRAGEESTPGPVVPIAEPIETDVDDD